jgi:hypothetical protein
MMIYIILTVTGQNPLFRQQRENASKDAILPCQQARGIQIMCRITRLTMPNSLLKRNNFHQLQLRITLQ